MASTTRHEDLLDSTIGYKLVWTIIAVLFALGVTGAIAWVVLKPPSVEDKARQDVRGAERLLERAKACAQADLADPDRQLLQNGNTYVEKAQSSISSKDFTGAASLALAAQDTLNQFVDSECAARDPVANFVRIQGDVEVKKANSKRYVPARKVPLSVGDRVQTGDGVATIVYVMNNKVQTIRPGSIIEIKEGGSTSGP